MSTSEKKSLAIIFPVYNESAGIEVFIQNLNLVCQQFRNKFDISYYAIDNGSKDNSLKILKAIKKTVKNLNIIQLTRNFGYEIAFEAGLREITSDFYCLIDSDGEDPVGLLPEFVKAIESDYKIAYGVRQERQENKFIVLLRKIFYRFLNLIADDPFKKDVGEFSMFSKSVRDQIIIDNNSYPFWRASISRSSFKSIGFPHKRDKRLSGVSKFKPRGMFTFALIGILSTTTWPLRLSIYINLISILILILYWIPGLMFNVISFNLILSVFLISTQITLISICMYLARTYKNGRGRPNYYIEEIIS